MTKLLLIITFLLFFVPRAFAQDVYSLTNPEQAAPFVTTNANGIAYRAFWNIHEPREGVYNWTSIDAALAVAKAAGLKFSLSVTPGLHTPNWVYTDGAKQFVFSTMGHNYVAPLPWDATYLAKWQTFVFAMGARYTGQIDHVTITGINSSTQEILLPQTLVGSQWSDLGYTNGLIESTWLNLLWMYASAFGWSVPLCSDHGAYFLPTVNGQSDDTANLIAMAATAYPNGGYIAQWNGWGYRSFWTGLDPYINVVGIGLQEGKPLGDLTSYRNAVNSLVGLVVPLYEEDYPTDLQYVGQ